MFSTRLWFLMLIVTLACAVAGCGSQPTSTTAPAGQTAAPPAATSPAAVGALGDALPDIPLHPTATLADEQDRQVQEFLQQAAALSRPDAEAAARVYVVTDSAEQVMGFYRDEMKARGWSSLPGLPAGGTTQIAQWQKGNATALVLVGESGGQRLLVVNRAETPPTPTPAAAEILTMKEAFDLLRQQSGAADLAFYAYQSTAMPVDGRTGKFTVSGYSQSQQKFCYVRSDSLEMELKCRDQATMDEPLVDDLDTLKDSPELLQEAIEKYGPCDTDVAFGINLTQEEAQFLCSANMWSGDLSPYK